MQAFEPASGINTLANTKQAKKRARQNEKRRQENKWQVSRMYTHVKKVLLTIATGDHGKAQTEYQIATSYIDRLVIKGLIHKNKAARHKSRLNKKVLALAA